MPRKTESDHTAAINEAAATVAAKHTTEIIADRLHTESGSDNVKLVILRSPEVKGDSIDIAREVAESAGLRYESLRYSAGYRSETVNLYGLTQTRKPKTQPPKPAQEDA